jgi:hypothetical protein
VSDANIIALAGIGATLLGTLGGIAIGKWMDTNAERKRWRRDQRSDAYRRALACAPLISASGAGTAAENPNVAEMFEALAAIEVYGSEAARDLAAELAEKARRLGAGTGTSSDLLDVYNRLGAQCRKELT